MDRASPRITLKELAAETGLSIAAISMALRNHPRISKATCQRVQALAKSLGYKPDPALSALVAYRQDQKVNPNGSTIALVYVAPIESVIPEREFKEELHGIQESAGRLGYTLDTFSCALDETAQTRTLRVIRNRGIRGIIFQFMDCDPSQWKVPWSFVAAVGIGIVARHSTLPLPTICTDHLHGSFDCMRQLGKLGFTRPALLLPNSYPQPLQTEILGGYLAGLRECAGNPKARDLLIDFGNDSWMRHFSSFLRKVKPDVIVSAGRAASLLGWLQETHPELAAEISVCTLDLEPQDLELSGMLQDRHGVGAVAMESLHKLILANVTGPFERSQDIQIPAGWRQGRSLHSISAKIKTPIFSSAQ